MSSQEYWEGRDLEKNTSLKEELIRVLGFDKVDTDGSTGTKGDMIGIKGDTRSHISIKYASGNNTQVHLPTLKSLAASLSMPDDIRDMLDKFLGTNDQAQFQKWSAGIALNADELKYQRLNSHHIPEFNLVIDWFNNNSKKIAQLLLQSLDGQNLVPYLIWAKKKSNTFQIIDVNKLVDWIVKECTWVLMPKGTVLRCAIPKKENQKMGYPIFFMQMKNSGGPEGGYNHNPQFHLNKHWPKDFVIYETNNFQF
jgi:hypothetical protein